MKIIDKDEIKIEYEKTHGDSHNNEAMIESLYQRRLNFLVNFEKDEEQRTMKRFKSIKSRTSLPGMGSENDTSLDGMGMNDETNMILLEEERKIRNQSRWLIVQYFLLTWLYISIYYKKKHTYLVVFSQVIFGNILFIIVFRKLGDPRDDTIVSIQNRLGFCYLMNLQGTFSGMNSSLLNFISSRRLFKKDKDSRLYSELPFYLAQLTYMIPIYLFLFFGLTYLYYYLMDLNRDPSLFYNGLKTYFFMFVGGFISGQSFSIVLGSICDSINTATALIPVVVAPLSISAGYLSNLKTASKPIQWIAYLSSMRFSYQGYALTEFQNSQIYVDSCVTYINCPDDPSKRCQIPVPDFMKDICDPMKVTDFVQTDVFVNMFFILGLIVFFRIMGFILFKWKSSLGRMRYKKNRELKKQIDDELEMIKELIKKEQEAE
jgi:ABC-type multidrug transport system permease subunit